MSLKKGIKFFLNKDWGGIGDEKGTLIKEIVHNCF